MLYILILVIGGIAAYFGPWWIIVVVAFGLSFWRAKTVKEGAGLSALALVTIWTGYSIFLNSTADVNLMDKVADIFTGGAGFLSKLPKTGFIFTIISLIASSVGALAGTAGVQVRNFFR